MRSKYKFLISVLTLAIFTLGISGCGGADYSEAANAALAAYNSANESLNQQLFKINDDNAILEDANWQQETLAAADTFSTAAKAFTTLPEAPSKYAQADALLKDLASKASAYADNARKLVNEKDLSLLSTLDSQITDINSTIDKIDAALDAANE